jgi:hypothetical protein
MKFDIKKLCTPAYVYLVISTISIVLMIIQNAGNTNTYCLGNYACVVENTAWVFAGKAFYVILWTYVLNLICSYGYRNISWFLVLFPFILFFILIGLFMLNQGVFILQNSSLYGGLREGLEGFKEGATDGPAAAKPEVKKPEVKKPEAKKKPEAPKPAAPAPKPAATAPKTAEKKGFQNMLSPATYHQ